MKKYSIKGYLSDTPSVSVNSEFYLVAEVETVVKDIRELCLELEVDVESAPFHKAASAILARLKVQP